MQRLDYRIDLYSDEEGLYDATITLPSGERIVVDPRNVFTHEEKNGG